MKECDILGGRNILWPSYISLGSQDSPTPNPLNFILLSESVATGSHGRSAFRNIQRITTCTLSQQFEDWVKWSVKKWHDGRWSVRQRHARPFTLTTTKGDSPVKIKWLSFRWDCIQCRGEHLCQAVWFSLTKTKTKITRNEKITISLTKTKTKTKKYWKLKLN